jgi:hypothetical protein
MKNLVLGYFTAAPNTRNQVLHIVANVLDFNKEERDRVGLEPGSSPSGWFRSFLQPGKGPSNMQVRYKTIVLLQFIFQPLARKCDVSIGVDFTLTE